MSVAEAKKQTQSVEEKIVALVLAEYIAKADQQPKGVLMACSSKGAVRWAGGTSIKLTGSPDRDWLLSAIQKDFDAEKGYAAQIEKDKFGNKTLEIRGPDEATWFVDPDTKEPSFRSTRGHPAFRCRMECRRATRTDVGTTHVERGGSRDHDLCILPAFTPESFVHRVS